MGKIVAKTLKEADVYLGEESPPLPVPELKISSTVPLDDLHCSQLLLSLGKSPAKQNLSKKDFSLKVILQCSTSVNNSFSLEVMTWTEQECVFINVY